MCSSCGGRKRNPVNNFRQPSTTPAKPAARPTQGRNPRQAVQGLKYASKK